MEGGLAPLYFGDGSNLQNINASNVNNGTLPQDVLPSSISSLTVTGDVTVGTSQAKGVILTSPNGTQYRLIVANDGTLSTSAV